MNKAQLFERIDAHFLAPERLARVRLFSRGGPHVEGWFKAELLFLFDSLRTAGSLPEWGYDVPLTEDKRQRCDFRLALADGPLYLEMKTLPAAQAEQQAAIGLTFDKRGDGSGLSGDLVKLMRVSHGTPGVLLFVHPTPKPDRWAQMLETYKRRVSPMTIAEETSAEKYPPELYVCKLAVKGGF